MPSAPVGQEAFAVIREAMRGKGMVALGRLVLSKRERVIALEPYDKGLLGTTLRYPYEVRKAEDYLCDLPRQWMDDLAHGRAASFAAIARREGKAERHIRLLAPLAFLSPRIVAALLDGTAPADLTLTQLARALPYSWTEQERRVGTSFLT